MGPWGSARESRLQGRRCRRRGATALRGGSCFGRGGRMRRVAVHASWNFKLRLWIISRTGHKSPECRPSHWSRRVKFRGIRGWRSLSFARQTASAWHQQVQFQKRVEHLHAFLQSLGRHRLAHELCGSNAHPACEKRPNSGLHWLPMSLACPCVCSLFLREQERNWCREKSSKHKVTKFATWL